MNSLVLKPCRCVVFFEVIPGFTPSTSGLRRAAGFGTEGRRSAGLRETGVFRRLVLAGLFFVVLRLTPEVFVLLVVVEAFFDL